MLRTALQAVVAADVELMELREEEKRLNHLLQVTLYLTCIGLSLELLS
jgi:hypothetical protein